MIMGFMTDEDIEWAVQEEVSFFVFEMGRVRKAFSPHRKQVNPQRFISSWRLDSTVPDLRSTCWRLWLIS